MPGCHLLSGESRPAELTDEEAEGPPIGMWPVDAALRAAGGVALNKGCVWMAELLGCGCWISGWAGCLPRRPDKLKNDLLPPMPEADRSRCREF